MEELEWVQRRGMEELDLVLRSGDGLEVDPSQKNLKTC